MEYKLGLYTSTECAINLLLVNDNIRLIYIYFPVSNLPLAPLGLPQTEGLVDGAGHVWPRDDHVQARRRADVRRLRGPVVGHGQELAAQRHGRRSPSWQIWTVLWSKYLLLTARLITLREGECCLYKIYFYVCLCSFVFDVFGDIVWYYRTHNITTV